MSEAELWAAWRLWLGVAVVIVLVAATLLITIIVVARSITQHAVRAIRAAERIRDNTAPVWALQTSNEVAGQLLEAVQAIEAKGGALAEALESTAGAAGAGGR